MSTLKVGGIRGVSASSDAITVANDGSCTASITNNLSNRNIIKNGAMMVDQRNIGSAVTCGASSGTTFGCDRMQMQNNNSGQLVFTAQQVADAPAGFYYSQKITITTPESTGATPDADDRSGMQYRMEGYDINPLSLGTANAKDFIVSFYIKVSTAGNYGLAIVNQSGTRSYCVLYPATTSWTRVTVKVPKDTSGTYAATNAQALALKFGFYNGSSRVGPDQGITGTGSWQASNAPQGTTGQTQLGGINGATWQITGLQLEEDSGSGVATDFEHRSFGHELASCQRYFYKVIGDSGDHTGIIGYFTQAAESRVGIHVPVPMRAAASYAGNGTGNMDSAPDSNDFDLSANTNTIDVQTTTQNPDSFQLQCIHSGGSNVGGHGCGLRFRSSGAFISLSAEI